MSVTARNPAGVRTVLLASPRSFCAGVERAIAIVEHLLDHRDGPVYVRKQIVHNTHVVADLQARGAVFVEELDAVPDGATVVFSAHGVSPAVRTKAADRGLDVIDATCPLVTKVHTEARRFAARGDTVILIGHAGHEEVEGTLGEAPDQTILLQTAEDVADLHVADPTRVSYLTQTTLAVDETAEIITHSSPGSPRCKDRRPTTSVTPRPTASTPSPRSPRNQIWSSSSARRTPPTHCDWWSSLVATALPATSSTIPPTSTPNGSRGLASSG